jgi:phospholipase/carboxylesterase
MSNNQETILSCLEINPSNPVRKCIIWLHGLGADGHDFVPIVPELHLPETLGGIRFIFPHAPIRPITINNGNEMRAWYDIASLTSNGIMDEIGIAKSVITIEKLIEKEESRGMASTDIILAGFSQGAVIAFATGLRHAKPLAGIIALSGYLPLAELASPKANAANQSIPIFIGHGTNDPIVPYSLGKVAYVTLKRAEFPVSWHSYSMGHSVCAEEIRDISQWIQTRFG